MALIHTPTPESEPAVQATIADARERKLRSLDPRERRAEVIACGLFLAAALALVSLWPAERDFEPLTALVVVAAMALAARAPFEVGSCYTMPVQIVFVPALFVLPPQAVPLCVAAGLCLGRLDIGRPAGRHPLRALQGMGDSWFALGPAVVLAAAGSPAPGEASLVILVAALASQFACDTLGSIIRERLHGGATVRQQVAESTWVYMVDLALSPVGFVIAFAAVQHAWYLLLVSPLFALMTMFARERDQRMDSLLELRDAYRGTAQVLGKLIEHDDAYTGLHTRGVVELSADVAEHLALGFTEQRNVEFAALLHDVGKINIPKEIINKPGPLNDEEWAIIKTHTLEGEAILAEIGGLMGTIGAVVRSAHERWDGGGYPDGLAGEAIPVESRIVFCCDAFNAMTTDRSYRSAMTAEAALTELRDNAGTQFDPAVVEAVEACVRDDMGKLAHPEPQPVAATT